MCRKKKKEKKKKEKKRTYIFSRRASHVNTHCADENGVRLRYLTRSGKGRRGSRKQWKKKKIRPVMSRKKKRTAKDA